MVRVKTMFALVVMGVVSASVSACGDDPDATNPVTSTSPTEPDTADADITVYDDRFEPANVTIKVGQRVRWTLASGTTHSVTTGIDASDPDAGADFDRELSPAITTYEQRYLGIGVYPFFSRATGIQGSVTVE